MRCLDGISDAVDMNLGNLWEMVEDKEASVQFSFSVSQSCPTLCDPMNRAQQASLSITNSWSLLKLMSIESVMPSSHLILCRPFPSYPQSVPASWSFPMSQLFA